MMPSATGTNSHPANADANADLNPNPDPDVGPTMSKQQQRQKKRKEPAGRNRHSRSKGVDANSGSNDRGNTDDTCSRQSETTMTSTRLRKRRHSCKGSSKYGIRISSPPNFKRKPMAELIQAISIYILCVSLPVIFGVIVRYYEEAMGMGATPIGGGLGTGLDEGKRGKGVFQSLLFSANRLWDARNEIPHTLYNTATSKLSSFFSSSEQVHQQRHQRLSEIQIVILASLFQSFIRVVLVHLLVPRCLIPRRLHAFVRTKSTHLLSSSEYPFQFYSNMKGAKPIATPPRNERYDQMSSMHPEEIDWRSQSLPSSPSKPKIKQYLNDAWVQTQQSVRRSLGHEDSTPIKAATSFDTIGAPPVTQMQQTTAYENFDATQALRLFSAPRYATAIFRLLFCFISCSYAYYSFRNADFWVVWLGGKLTSSTKNCWDLSGSVFVPGMDSGGSSGEGTDRDADDTTNVDFDVDFDHQNHSLRVFFLGQISYQVQSFCFHLLSMILLIMNGGFSSNNNNGGNGGDNGGIIISARSSFKSYVRPLLEHSLYLILTVATFFFSALRRLGSILIFALEISSMVLQILQICINAPDSSPLRLHPNNHRIISILHRYVAIPIFVYCRFFIIPFVVQYSALFESELWLRQIEQAVFLPGCAMLLYLFFNGMLFLVFALNFVYLRRLLFHPIAK